MKWLKWLLLFTLANCTPEPPDGSIRCATPPAKECPDGYACAADHNCWRHPDDYVPDAHVSVRDLGCDGSCQ